MKKINKIVSIIISFTIVFTTAFFMAPKTSAVSENTTDYSTDDNLKDEYENQVNDFLGELIPGEDFVENEILIKYKSDVETQSLESISEECDFDIECNLDLEEEFNTFSVNSSSNDMEDGLYLASIDENDAVLDVIQELSTYDSIEYAQPNYIYKTCEITNQFNVINESEPKGFQCQQAMFNSLNLGNTNYTGNGVVVAVIDTGIDLSHPALAGCFWSDNGVVGYNTANKDNVTEITMSQDAIYTNDHGTHVAGIIAMQEKENFTCKGIAPNVKIMDLQASHSGGSFKSSSIIKALELAEEHGADIVNMSLGGKEYDNALNLACNRAARKMILVAASGNDSYDREAIFPAAFSSVIGVVAYGGSPYASEYDNNNIISDNLSLLNANYPSSGFMTIAKFSNYDSKSKYFDTVAPGVNICSTKARTDVEKNIENFADYDYTFMSGTSMASPIIAGVAALYLEKNPNATPGQVRNALSQDSGKKVKFFDCLNEINNIPSSKFILNQVDVSTILSRTPDTQVDAPYTHNSDENYENFCEYVKKQFKNSFSTGEIITDEDLRLISFLQITNYSEVQSFYSQLSEFSNLLGLYIYGSSFSDSNFKLISNNNSLNNLDVLTITNTNISYLELPNEFCPDLFDLCLEKNYSLKELSNLSVLDDLSIISINYGLIENLDFLIGSDKIKDLSIVNNRIVDLTSLSNLISIENLELNNNYITDISPISNLSNLIKARFSNNYITDISLVENLSNLTHLFLDNNLIDDIGNVLMMPNLSWLYLNENLLKSKESEIESFLKSKKIPESNVSVFNYKPFKEIISAENILAYDCTFKRSDFYYNPDIAVFPYNASFAHNVKLSSTNNKIKVNPYSNTLSYNNNYQYNMDDTVFESLINYQCNNISGSFKASLLMPIITSASIEKYCFDNADVEKYLSILTTTDTTKVKVEQGNILNCQLYEYNLTSDNVSYYDYEYERIIKIKLDDNISTDNNILISAGDEIGYFATTTVSDNSCIDVQIENSMINNMSGSADMVLLSLENLEGIKTNSIKENCDIGTLILSDSISNISSNAFNNCNISELYITNKCVNCNNNIFKNCNGMTVYVSHDSPIASFSGALINSDYEYLCGNNVNKLQKYYGNDSNVTLPKYFNLTTIGQSAFQNNTYIEKINLSDNIKSIENNAFNGCSNLSNIGGVLNLSQIEKESFKGTGIENVIIKYDNSYIDNYCSSVFENCNNLNLCSISYEKSIISIGRNFFKNCNNLKYINFNNNVSLHESCFEDCNSLKAISFDKITFLGKRAFKNCSSLSGEAYCVCRIISDEAFYNCSGITSISLKNNVTINSNVFNGTTSLKTIGFISSENECKSDSFSDSNSDLVIYTNGYSLTNIDTGTIYSNSEINVCPDYKLVLNSYRNIMLTEYSGTAADVNIPECLKIYEIGKEVFYCKQFIRSVYIPDSVKNVDQKAFSMDMNLETLKGGKNVLFIEEDAFYNCKKLKDISSMESIKSIGAYAFAWTGIESLSLPQTIIWVFEGAFFCCKQLKEIELPGMLSGIPAGCFYLCDNLERCIIHYNCKSINDSAFYGCTNLNQLYLPISVCTIQVDSLPQNTIIYCEANALFINKIRRYFGNTVIPNYEVVNKILIDYQSETGYDYIDENDKKVIDVPNAVEEIRSSRVQFGGIFENNREAQIYILPKSLKVIDQCSFYDSKAEKIIMPNSIQSIGANAFNKCNLLKEITIPNGLETIETNTFFQTRCVGYKIPDSVTEIKSGAFWHCDMLKSVYIPDTVTNIESNAFADCNDNLVIYGYDSDYLNEYVQNNSNKNGNNNLVYKSGYDVNGNIFTAYDGNEENVQIPYGIGLSQIADEAFKNNISVKSVSIASGITHIGESCFENCTSLTAVIIPDDVESIGDNAFNGVPGLTVYCNSGSFAEDYCIENNITVVTDYDVSDGVLKKYNGSETNVLIPDNLCLVEIGRSSFYNINSIQSIRIPEGVTVIGYDAIGFCNNLTSVTLPTTIQKLNSFAFWCNPMLTIINNSEFIKDIDAYAFSGCNSLNTLNLSGVKKLSYNVFNNCNSLTTVTIGREAASVDYRAFNNCDNVSICCYENSYIHQFAIENNIPYILLASDETNESESGNTNMILKSKAKIPENNQLGSTEDEALENYITNKCHGEVTEENIGEVIDYMVSNGWWI